MRKGKDLYVFEESVYEQLYLILTSILLRCESSYFMEKASEIRVVDKPQLVRNLLDGQWSRKQKELGTFHLDFANILLWRYAHRVFEESNEIASRQTYLLAYLLYANIFIDVLGNVVEYLFYALVVYFGFFLDIWKESRYKYHVDTSHLHTSCHVVLL